MLPPGPGGLRVDAIPDGLATCRLILAGFPGVRRPLVMVRS